MDPEISLAKLNIEIQKVLQQECLITYHGWKLRADGLVLYVNMHPRVQPRREYLARLVFEDFPQRPPAFTFVDAVTQSEGKEWWPPHGAFAAAVSRNPSQLCIRGVREFHEQLHREQPWDAERYPLIQTLEVIQAELNKGHPAD